MVQENITCYVLGKMPDVLADLGHLALGSRLKRLAERLQSDAALIHASTGEDIQPGQFPLVAALDRYGPLTVNEAVKVLGVSQPAVTRALSELTKVGWVETTPSAADRRQKTIAFTDKGRASVDRLKSQMWPRVAAAARDICEGLSGDFLSQITEFEQRIADRSLADRYAARSLRIVEFAAQHAAAFHDINAEWIQAMFELEAHDLHVLQNPRETIIDVGGEILFVEAPGLGLIGACALQPGEHGFIELTKMGVLQRARGLKAGEFLLHAVLERARARGFADKLYLVTNQKCQAAIHLYEKLGFEHDDEIMALFGKRYARCDVAMRFRG